MCRPQCRKLAVLIVAVACFPAFTGCGPKPAKPTGKPKPAKTVRRSVEKERFGSYEVRIYHDHELGSPGDSLEILKDGTPVYRKESYAFWVGNPDWSDRPKRRRDPPMGKDITGDGVPDLVVGEFTGGAHCCSFAHVFQLGARFRKLATISGLHSDVLFRDVDQDGPYEAVLNDWTFAYWKASFADSPAPEVMLRFRNGRYLPATDLMHKAAPSLSDLAERASRIRSRWPKREEEGLPSEMWREMLDLIYTGQAGLAYKFLDMAWNPREPNWTKTRFRRAFDRQLATSPYWPAIRRMNGL